MNIVSVCITSKQARAKLKEVPAKEQGELFDGAKKDEIAGIVDTGSVSVVPKSEAVNLVPTRFVCTWKCDENGRPIKPKARLVVWGHTDPDLPWLRTDAPTISELGTNTVFQAAASWRTPLFHGDIK